ncbi:MAG: maleylpyruvate isomerase N-terminal domain-containing protein [Flavobacteriales bacterium]|nr:maleylpyruvate isomerase N-terminal domain-containing protein [Flavobacteriales bacterium]
MKDFTQLSRTDWIKLIEEFNTTLYNSVTGLTRKQWNRRTPYLGWRVRDVMANITRAKVVNFHPSLDRALDDYPIAPKEFDTFLRCQREVEARRHVSIGVLLDEFMTESDYLLDRYRHMSDEDFLKPGWFFVGPLNVRGLLLTEFGDNVFHLRDMLQPNGKWQGFDPSYSEPLVDWFMREYRPAHFRADRADHIHARIQYRLSGVGGGTWTMRIVNNRCIMSQGAHHDYDAVIESSAEDMVSTALGRTSPWLGSLARSMDWFAGVNRKSDVVAAILHYGSYADAFKHRRFRFMGDRDLGMFVNRKCFWHFYQRTSMTHERISQSRGVVWC